MSEEKGHYNRDNNSMRQVTIEITLRKEQEGGQTHQEGFKGEECFGRVAFSNDILNPWFLTIDCRTGFVFSL